MKPSKFIKEDWLNLRRKFKVGVALAKEKGWIFKIYDESRIHTQHFKNIRYLERFRNFHITEDIIESDINLMMDANGISIGGLVSHLNAIKGKGENLSPLVWHLVYIKFFRCDLSRELNLETKVWLNANQDRKLPDGW